VPELPWYYWVALWAVVLGLFFGTLGWALG